jgi:cell wall-associated NlpC family hydrolase
MRLLVSFLLMSAASADLIVQEARESVGTPYVWAQQSEKSTDCAGLVRRVAAVAGIAIPRTSRAQYASGRPIPASDLRPGDLVFFKNTYRRGISHVGIYVGEGEFIHAASRRRRVVVDRLDKEYFAARFAGARRIVDDAREPLPPLCAIP